MTKLRFNMTFDFDVTHDINEYLLVNYNVEPEEATQEQYRNAFNDVMEMYSEKRDLRDFIDYMASATPVNLTLGEVPPANSNRPYFTFTMKELVAK